MLALISELQEVIPKAFEEKSKDEERKELIDSLQKNQRSLMNDLEIKAKELNFTLKIGQGNFTVIPLINGEPAKEEVLEELSEDSMILSKSLGFSLFVGPNNFILENILI